MIPHTRHNRLALLVLAASTAVTLAAGSARGQQPAWKTGAALRKQLDTPVGFVWQNQPLREGLEKLSRSYGLAVFLDRRVDPDELLTLTVQETPLENVIRKIAADSPAQMAQLGPVIYIGPPGAAAKITTLAALRRQDVVRAPNDVKAKFSRAEAWRWEELSQPKELLRDLARQANVSIVNHQLVPHDLWPAVSLPPLPWTDRLTLLLIGFGLTFEIDPAGTAVRVMPMPGEVSLEKRYTPRGSPVEVAAQLRRLLPECELRVDQGQLIAKGSQDDHDKIERLLAGQTIRTTPLPKKGAGEKLYSLQVENETAGNIVNTIAKFLGKELKYDDAVREKLKTEVSFKVKDVTINYLLEITLEPLGLAAHQTDTNLEIVSVPSP